MPGEGFGESIIAIVHTCGGEAVVRQHIAQPDADGMSVFDHENRRLRVHESRVRRAGGGCK